LVGFWSEDESKILKKYYEIYGANYATIAKKLPGRTAQQIKDRIRYLHRKKEGYTFSNEDDR